MSHSIHIIAGPTASGKSAAAIALAQAQNGVIINADATQCYRELHILSARPSPQELAQAPHALYGMWSGEKAASVADWLQEASKQIQQCWQQGQLPIICGGTGFYLKALKEGLSPIPDIPPEIREKWQQSHRENGNDWLHAQLQQHDPAAAARIPAGNTQRLIRALEVVEFTGTALSQWQNQPRTPPFPEAKFVQDIKDLDRDELYARCDARFDQMLEHGALEEVKTLLSYHYDLSLPIMKAVGVPELAAYLQGEIDLTEATRLAKRNTRRYAKRQLTWLRHQL